jgi:hypothetical protein
MKMKNRLLTIAAAARETLLHFSHDTGPSGKIKVVGRRVGHFEIRRLEGRDGSASGLYQFVTNFKMTHFRPAPLKA